METQCWSGRQTNESVDQIVTLAEMITVSARELVMVIV